MYVDKRRGSVESPHMVRSQREEERGRNLVLVVAKYPFYFNTISIIFDI